MCEGWLIVYSTCNREQEERTRSDNLRRYQAIRNALVQASPAPPTGNLARHLSTLAALISGIVGSKSTPLPTIAAKVSVSHLLHMTFFTELYDSPGPLCCVNPTM